ncbi:MAG: transcriptional regulator [bacterium]|nr:transcriptional regulator [bacterium]
MKQIINHLNKCFENRTRLGIMAALMVNDSIDFKALKQLLGTTDGNLSSNVSTLEQYGYVKVKKRFIEKTANTSYSVTKVGRKAFENHLSALEELIRGVGPGQGR